MPTNTYSVSGDRPSNEELARRIQAGDKQAEEALIVNNEGYLIRLASRLSSSGETDDLIQEGALALLKAARSFDPSHGTKLLTYATPVIEKEMLNCISQQSSPVRIPNSRYNQLRKVAYICSTAEDTSESALVAAVCEKLGVSEKVAAKLLCEYRTVFRVPLLGDASLTVHGASNPTRSTDHTAQLEQLYQKMEEILSPRELNLVRYHLGLAQPDKRKMTFQELAARLNYNSPSGAEKAYKRAIQKIKNSLHSGKQ